MCTEITLKQMWCAISYIISNSEFVCECVCVFFFLPKEANVNSLIECNISFIVTEQDMIFPVHLSMQ